VLFLAISNYLSLYILFNVPSSLQDIFGLNSVVKNSPTKASICLRINGVNYIEVGFPIPKLSSRC